MVTIKLWCSMVMAIFLVLFSIFLKRLIKSKLTMPAEEDNGSFRKSQGHVEKTNTKRIKTLKEIYPADCIEQNIDIKVIVFACADSRFQSAFRSFIKEVLRLKPYEFVLITKLRGVNALAHPIKCKNDYRSSIEQINLCLEYFSSAGRMVFLDHEDCKYYKKTIGGLPGEEIKNLKSVVRRANELLQGKGIKVEGHFAKFIGKAQTGIMFEEIDPS